jgi:hypothetical protein
MLVSGNVIEIKILLIDQTLYHFMRHPVVEVSGQLHAPYAIPPGKEPLVFISQKAE